MSEKKPEICDECGEEHGPDREFELLMALEQLVYEAIAKNFGPAELLSDEDFEAVAGAVLGLVSVSLEEDLELFDLKDLKVPPKSEQN